MHDEERFRIANALEALVRLAADGNSLRRIEERLDALTALVRTVVKLEVQQMAFGQVVLEKIKRQTTLIGSIKEWIRNLPVDEVPADVRAAIEANLDANEADLATVIPANTPLDPNTP